MTLATRSALADPIPVATLFEGFDSFTGSAADTAVQGTTNASAGPNTHTYAICTDYASLLSAINISASVADSMYVDSLSAKMQFVQNLQITTYSVTVVVYSCDIVTNVGSDFLLAIPEPTDLNAFFQGYGDSFVMELQQGAEYIAAYVFYSQTEEEQTSVTTALSAAGVSEDGDLNASFTAGIEKVTQTVQTRQTFQDLLIGVTGLDSPQPAQLVDFALNFSTVIRTPPAQYEPAVLSFSTTGYESIPGFPDFTAIVNNRELLQGSTGQPGLADDLATLQSLQNQVQWITQVYTTYAYTGDIKFASRTSQVGDDLRALQGYIQEINSDPTQSYPIPNLPSLQYGMPALTFELAYGPAWGTDNATPFADATVTSILNQQTLTALQIWGGSVINILTLTYCTPTAGQVIVQHGTSKPNQPPNPTLFLAPGEFITQINATYGQYVHSLSITTSKGQTLEGPSHPGHATDSDQWTPVAGSVLVGFQGTSHTQLGQLQAVTCTFSPAVWSPSPPTMLS